MKDSTPGEADRAQSLELRDYLRILRTYWLGSVLIVLLALLAGAGWTITQPRIYASTASGLVEAPGGDDPNMAFAADSLSKSQAQSFVQLAGSLSVAETAAKAIHFDGSPAALLSKVQANLPDSTAVISITAYGSTSQSAAALANAWVKGIAKQITVVQNSGTGIAGQSTRFVQLASATIPSAPFSPDVKTALLVAGLLGIILGFIYAIVRNHLDRRVRSAAYLEENFDVSVLGTVPVSPLLINGSHVVISGTGTGRGGREESFAMSEALRELRTNLSYVNVDNRPRVIVVTSPRAGDGKSTIAANLAEALATSSPERVVAIDCDLRRPNLSKTFGVVEGAGLTDVLSGRARLGDVMQQTGSTSNLWVVGSGRIPPNPSELLGSKALKDVLATLGEHAMVILDAPPVLSVTDAVVLSNSADGILLVVSAKRTTYDQVSRSLQLIRRGGGVLLGAVLNRVPTKGQDARDYGYYGGSYYYYDSEQEAAILNQVEKDLAAVDSTEGSPLPEATAPQTAVPQPAEPVLTTSRRARRLAEESATTTPADPDAV